MLFPETTAFYAAVLALYFVLLSLWTIGKRVSSATLFGDGGDDALQKRIRSHGNFIEYAPFALLLIALLEMSGASHLLVRILLIVLLVARLLHPVGMLAPENSPRQFACRGGGILATLIVILVTAVALLVRLA